MADNSMNVVIGGTLVVGVCIILILTLIGAIDGTVGIIVMVCLLAALVGFIGYVLYKQNEIEDIKRSGRNYDNTNPLLDA